MSLISPKSPKILVVTILVFSLGVIVYFLLLFFPKSQISKTSNSRLNTARTAISQQFKIVQNKVTTGYHFVINLENENANLGKVKMNKTKVKMDKISSLLDKLKESRGSENQIHDIIIFISDVPQSRNYAWQDAKSNKINYSGYSVKEFSNKLQSTIFLNIPEMKKYGWNNEDVLRELEFLFYLSLLTSEKDTNLEYERKYQEARTIYLEANIDDKVPLFSFD